jgi:hypothetical protein
MAKRHVQQDKKQRLGSYYTTRADLLLEGYEHLPTGRRVVDPFAGNWDLLNWALRHGAGSVSAYDILPHNSETTKNDSLLNPPDYSGALVLTNPPYLNANKCRNDSKEPYYLWGQDDYYKCHLASLASRNCEEAIIIVPTNFFCESRVRIRTRLFQTHYIESAKYWEEPVFDDATTGVAVVHLVRGGRQEQRFQMRLLPSGACIDVCLKQQNGYLHGDDFFDYIGSCSEIRVLKTDVGMPPPNTRLVVGLLDWGARPFGLSLSLENDIYCQPLSFTTYQLTLPDHELSLDQQRQVADLFQRRLQMFRAQYHGMFLANYMGARQKILSRSFVNRLLAAAMHELGIHPSRSDRTTAQLTLFPDSR